MDQSSPSDEFDTSPRPIVAIPWRWSGWLGYVAPALLIALVVLILVVDPGNTAGIGAFWPLAWMLIIQVPIAIWLSRAPEFAMFKDGIKVNVQRFPPGRSTWDPWNYGFYRWSEVSYCHWSPYQAGVLSVHLEAADQQRRSSFGVVPDSLMRMPPMIHFYRVPEAYRAAVEAAIRAWGKWID